MERAIKNATIAYQEPGYELEVTLEYSDLENFKYYCGKNNIRIIDNEYLDNVICKIELNIDEKDKLEDDYKNQNSLKIKKIDKIRQKNISALS